MTDGISAYSEAIQRSFPSRALADTPTPVDRHAALAEEFGARSVCIKRDDVSGVEHGGNKVRKLEFLLADALERGCRGVVTYGAAGSNHVLSTSLFARKLGLECVGIVRPQPPTPYVEETLRHHLLLGTRLEPAGSAQETETIRSRLPGGSSAWYEIPLGGSSPLGSLGYVCAALELAEQVAAGHCPAPDLIYLPCGSSGSAVGLDFGATLAGLPSRIVAAWVVTSQMTSKKKAVALAGKLRSLLHGICPAPGGRALGRVEFREEFLGDGYALPSGAALEAIEWMKSKAGARLEYTYSGKAAAALLHDGRAGRFRGLNVMFWNTYNSRPAPSGLPPLRRGNLPGTLQESLPAGP